MANLPAEDNAIRNQSPDTSQQEIGLQVPHWDHGVGLATTREAVATIKVRMEKCILIYALGDGYIRWRISQQKITPSETNPQTQANRSTPSLYSSPRCWVSDHQGGGGDDQGEDGEMHLGGCLGLSIDLE
jgi:hypothetical protein